MAVKTRKRNSSLSKRAKISYETKDYGGGGSRIIDWKKIDGEIQFLQPAVGKNAINIIPFAIKSKNHPLVRQGQMEIGELDYCLDIWVHRNIGPSESSVICLKKTYGKACPICEEAEKMRKAGKDEESKALYSKRRCFYNVEDVRKKPGELQVFDVSYHLFEKELIDEARNEEEGAEEFIDFADPRTGSVIHFRCSVVKKGRFEFNEYKSFSFKERDEQIDDELLEKAISFDAYLNVPSYEEAQAILYGADEDKEEDEEEEEEKPVRKSSAKAKGKAVDEEEEDDDEDDEEDSEDDEDDEEDTEDDDPPSGKKAGKNSASGNGKCPYKHTFGKDADKHEECEDCDEWVKCTKAKKQ